MKRWLTLRKIIRRQFTLRKIMRRQFTFRKIMRRQFTLRKIMRLWFTLRKVMKPIFQVPIFLWELCIWIMIMCLCILLRKNPFFRWFCKHTWTTVHTLNKLLSRNYCNHGKLVPLNCLACKFITTVCSSSDLVVSISSLCVWRCGHLLVLLLTE